MRFVEGDRLDDAEQLILNHSWVSHMPQLSSEQMGELLAVWMDWYREEFRQAKPKRKKDAPTRSATEVFAESRGRRLVYARSTGLCEAAADGCEVRAREWQHRKNRSQRGTWAPSNGLHVCRACHRWIHANPTAARGLGWMVWSFEDPAEIPVMRWQLPVLLDDDGGFEPVEKGTAA